MFRVDGDTITLSRGDTGSVVFRLTGCSFTADDRALFTVKNQAGTVVKQGVYPLEDGAFTVDFLNAETDYLAPGQYSYDVRYVIGPAYDESGKIVDGDQVITPDTPKRLVLLDTVGQI